MCSSWQSRVGSHTEDPRTPPTAPRAACCALQDEQSPLLAERFLRLLLCRCPTEPKKVPTVSVPVTSAAIQPRRASPASAGLILWPRCCRRLQQRGRSNKGQPHADTWGPPLLCPASLLQQ